MGKGASAVRTLEAAAELANRNETLAVLKELDVHVSQVGFVPGCGKRSPIAMAKPCGIEYLHHFEVPATQDFATQVLERRYQQGNRTVGTIAEYGRNTKRLGAVGILRAGMIDECLRVEHSGEATDIDVNEIG